MANQSATIQYNGTASRRAHTKIQVPFTFSKENLEGIVKAIKPSGNDHILVDCKDCDLAFALLESGAKVTAVDRNKKQLSYAWNRAMTLADGDLNGFIMTPPLTDSAETLLLNERNDYFRDRKFKTFEGTGKIRIKNIQSNLKNLNLMYVNDFLDAAEQDKFNKAYLSNMLSYRRSEKATVNSICDYLGRLANALKMPGIIYISDSNILTRDSDMMNIEPHFIPGWPKNLTIDKESTLNALYNAKGLEPVVLYKYELLNNKKITPQGLEIIRGTASTKISGLELDNRSYSKRVEDVKYEQIPGLEHGHSNSEKIDVPNGSMLDLLTDPSKPIL